MSRAHDRRPAPERRAGVGALLRQRRDGWRSRPTRGRCAARTADYRERRGVPRSAQHLLESGLSAIPRSIPDDRPDADAVPCAARELLHRSLGRRVSLHHLLAAARAPARHGHAPRADLERAPRRRSVQREIWQGQCPQCWTACEAYQSILGNVLAGRLRAPRPSRPPLPRAPSTSRSARDERHLLHRRRRSRRTSTRRSRIMSRPTSPRSSPPSRRRRASAP